MGAMDRSHQECSSYSKGHYLQFHHYPYSRHSAIHVPHGPAGQT